VTADRDLESSSSSWRRAPVSPRLSSEHSTGPAAQRRPCERANLRPLVFFACVAVSAVHCTAVARLLLRVRYEDGGKTSALSAEKGADPARSRLCRPARTRRKLVVEIPFTGRDVPSLEVAVALWDQFWPCYQPPLRPLRPDLILGFNGNLSDRKHATTRIRLAAIAGRPAVQACFGRVSIESAYLSGATDTYDKRRVDANWTVGPNNLFFYFLDLAIARGYDHMLQLEPDVFPLRPLWLEQLACLATHTSAWVIGSPFLSHCARDARSQKCDALGAHIKFHLNGNALYSIGDAGFRAFFAHAFASDLSRWPFDLAMHVYAAMLSDAARRRLATKFRAHPYILNFGAEPLTRDAVATAVAVATGAAAAFRGHDVDGYTVPTSSWPPPLASTPSESASANVSTAASGYEEGILPMLRHASPSTYLVHSSWAMAEIWTHGVGGYMTLGLNRPRLGRSDGGGSAAADSRGTGGQTASTANDLLSLARRVADEQGRLLLTFATAVYDALCVNFVAHTRRLGLTNYLLVTFTAAYHKVLAQRGERPHLHSLPAFHSGGSDIFASREFFTVNAARYTVLTKLLRGGLHIFALDLDVALLQDPFPHVWSEPYELLLQSDARDAVTLSESSPFLLRDRLHLMNASGVTYVNGGVFFARGTHAVARLFEDTWALTSQDLGALNEQDTLNRMLLASAIRWAPLPPCLFPNGFVFFRRPVGSPRRAAAAAAGPVLVHCNWINGISAKRYLLREAGMWAGDDDASRGRRFLAYAVGPAAVERTLGAQLIAFRVAVALAHLTNRTLVLPTFSVLPPDQAFPTGTSQSTQLWLRPRNHKLSEAHSSAVPTSEEGWRTLTYLFEYAPMLRHFPQHAESTLLRERWGDKLPPAEVMPELRVAGSSNGAAAADNHTSMLSAADAHASAAPGARARAGGRQVAARTLLRWLNERRTTPLLHVAGLRAWSKSAPSSALGPLLRSLFGDYGHAFERRLLAALQPAPELRVISNHIVTTIHAYIHRELGLRQPSEGAGSLRRLASAMETPWGEGFNCLHVTPDELASAHRLRAAAGDAPRHTPTLLVYELGVASEVSQTEGDRRDGDVGVTGADGYVSGTSHRGEKDTWALRDPLRAISNGLARDARTADGWRLRPPRVASEVFGVPLLVSDFYPYWDAAEVTDIHTARTLAYDMVQQLVCSAARNVYGDPRRDFVQGVCHWRRSGSSGSKRASLTETCTL